MDVRGFFSQWDIYRLCIEHNTLHHREVESVLRAELARRRAAFRFLDLASGDATVTSRALASTHPASYTAVDFSAPALALAETNTASLPCPRRFLEMDYTEFLGTSTERFDVVYLGLSLHHLDGAGKDEAMHHLHRILSPDGCLLMFEPILHGGEGRDECLARWHRAMDGPYGAFPPAAREAVWDHVRTFDQPESLEDYLQCGLTAGFSTMDVLFRDPGNFYTLMRFQS